MNTCSLFFTAFAITLFVSPLADAKNDFVGTFGKWHVQTYVEGGSKVCLMWSQPEKSKGKYKRRGDIYAYVTQRPAAKRLNEISISIGYKFKKEARLAFLSANQSIRCLPMAIPPGIENRWMKRRW